MDENRSNLAKLLHEARNGCTAAREGLLAMYRPYLRSVAGRRLPRVVQKRLDASDIVQQAMLDAVRGLPDFRGETEREFTAWMMRLLERNLLQCIRDNTLGKRDVRLEHNWTNGSGSAVMVWQSLADKQSSPISRMFRGEAALRLAAALEKLPSDQRKALELRYTEQQTLQAIADEMGRTLSSVVALIRRGVASLHAVLPADFGELG